MSQPSRRQIMHSTGHARQALLRPTVATTKRETRNKKTSTRWPIVPGLVVDPTQNSRKRHTLRCPSLLPEAAQPNACLVSSQHQGTHSDWLVQGAQRHARASQGRQGQIGVSQVQNVRSQSRARTQGVVQARPPGQQLGAQFAAHHPTNTTKHDDRC